MHKNFAHKVFCHWLRDNHSRFNNAPVFVRVRRGYFIFRFYGIAPEIICRISKYGMIEIYAIYQGAAVEGLATNSCRISTDNHSYFQKVARKNE